MSDPKILVAGTPDRRGYYGPYLEAVRGAGGDPELDLPDPTERATLDAVREFLHPYRGILFPGGADIDPAWYGAGKHPKLGKVDGELDAGQFALARIALAADLPLLGICRGLQLLAAAVCQPLIQDLPSERPDSKIEHVIMEPKDRLAHAVDLDPASRLAEISGGNRFEVNSRHHQAAQEDPAAADRIGPFRITARASDGVVEGLEDPRGRFLVAVQWHPENLTPAHAPSGSLFRAFVEACGR